MRLAVPDRQGRVSPVFDVAEQVVVVDVDGQRAGDVGTERLGDRTLQERVQRLRELRVDVVVCGAISRPLESLLGTSGMQVISLVCGDVSEVIGAFCEGTLHEERFAMPGCRRQRRQARTRRRGGGSRLNTTDVD